MYTDIGKYLLYLAILMAWAVYILSLRKKSYTTLFRLNLASFLGIFISYIMMLMVLLSKDYSMAIVYNYTSSSMSLAERISALWVARAPIMTLWGLYMMLISVITLYYVRNEFNDPVVQNMTKLIFLFSAIIISFAVSARPGAFDQLEGDVFPNNGKGLEPSLLSKWNLLHPPLAFLGYSSFIVPFAAGIAILNAYKSGTKISSRIYYLIDFFMLLAWCLNSILLLAGSLWGYEENWSGFWAWDPVEIASVVMWAGATLYFHVKSLVEQDHPLRPFTATLGWLGVAFASFIVRSGILSGLHSYTSVPQTIVFGLMLAGSILVVTITVLRSGVALIPDHIYQILGSTRKTSVITFWLLFSLITVNVVGLTMQIINALAFSNEITPRWYYIPLNSIILISLAVLLPLCEMKWEQLKSKPQLYYVIAFFVVSLVYFFLSGLSILLIFAAAVVMTALLLQIQITFGAIRNKHALKKMGRHLVHIATLLLIVSYVSGNYSGDRVYKLVDQDQMVTIDEFDFKIWVDRIIDPTGENSRIEVKIYDMDEKLLDTLALTDGFYGEENEYWVRGDYYVTPFYDFFFHQTHESFSFQLNAPIGLNIDKVANANLFRFSFFAVFSLSIISVAAMTRRKPSVSVE
ncbi:MAG: cytochrome c biogenesis protein CcsA [Candidatus Heimdallarchaeota archaeon]|nr:cytochrome c biogenesis protein CcsA [Candidatus Heimdallarchaeota archaeon]